MEAVENNQNVAWINERGAWWFYLLLIGLAYYVCFLCGMPNDVSTSAVVIGHTIVTYLPSTRILQFLCFGAETCAKVAMLCANLSPEACFTGLSIPASSCWYRMCCYDGMGRFTHSHTHGLLYNEHEGGRGREKEQGIGRRKEQLTHAFCWQILLNTLEKGISPNVRAFHHKAVAGCTCVLLFCSHALQNQTNTLSALCRWEDDSGKYDKLTYWEQIDGGQTPHHQTSMLDACLF